MLPRSRRVNRPDEFRRVLRRGRKAGRRRLVLHALVPAAVESGSDARAGLVVGKAVGNAVVRHRVSRRLRHVLGARLAGLPVGTALVVRAQPPAATATSDELAADLDAALARLGLAASGPQGLNR